MIGILKAGYVSRSRDHACARPGSASQPPIISRPSMLVPFQPAADRVELRRPSAPARLVPELGAALGWSSRRRHPSAAPATRRRSGPEAAV